MKAPECPPQWQDTLLLIQRGWAPNDFSVLDMIGYALHFDGLEPATVELAVRRLSRSGRKFYPRPSASDICGEAMLILRPDLAPRPWTEVAVSLEAALREAPPMVRRERAQVVGEIVKRELGAIAGAWAAMVALDIDSLSRDSLRREWEGYEPQIRERAMRGIEPLTPEQAVLGVGRVSQVIERPGAVPALTDGRAR